MKAAAFRASYADWKLIRTRNCVQVVFEIPLEEHDAAYQALGGMPDPARERWFGIARLDLEKAGAPASRGVERTDPDKDIPAPRLRKPVAPEKRLAQQAGILCSDPVFWRFLNEIVSRNGVPNATPIPITTEKAAAELVRWICGIKSRSEIASGSPSGELWEELHTQFRIWRDHPDLVPA